MLCKPHIKTDGNWGSIDLTPILQLEINANVHLLLPYRLVIGDSTVAQAASRAEIEEDAAAIQEFLSSQPPEVTDLLDIIERYQSSYFGPDPVPTLTIANACLFEDYDTIARVSHLERQENHDIRLDTVREQLRKRKTLLLSNSELTLDQALTYAKLPSGTSFLLSLINSFTAQVVFNVRDESKQTPLHLATQYGIIENVKLFLEKGADINVKDKNGWTPLHIACKEGNLELCRLFITRYAASVLALTYNFGTPLHYLVLSATEENWVEHQKIIKLLLEEGADINSCNAEGDTPLLRLCIRKNLPCVQFLIQNGASVNTQNCLTKCTPLHVAIRSGDIDLVKLLLDSGCDPLMRCSEGDAMQVAIRYKREDIKALIHTYTTRVQPNSMAGHRYQSSPILISDKQKGPSTPEIAMSIPPKASGSFTSIPKFIENARIQMSTLSDGNRSAEDYLLETYTCILPSNQQGEVQIWQCHVQFTPPKSKPISIPMREITAIQQKHLLHRHGVEIVRKRDKYLFTNFTVPLDEVYNLLKFLHSYRLRPMPVFINGIPLRYTIGLVKYPDIVAEMQSRFGNILETGEILVEYFHAKMYSTGIVQTPLKSGRVYVTLQSVWFYSRYFAETVSLQIKLSSIAQITEKDQGLEISYNGSNRLETRFFSFDDPAICTKAVNLIETQQRIDAERSRLPVVGICSQASYLSLELLKILTAKGIQTYLVLFDEPNELTQLDVFLSLLPNRFLENVEALGITPLYISQINPEDIKDYLAGVNRLVILPPCAEQKSSFYAESDLQEKSQNFYRMLEILLGQISSVLKDLVFVSPIAEPEIQRKIDQLYSRLNLTQSNVIQTNIKIAPTIQTFVALLNHKSQLISLPLSNGILIPWINLADVKEFLVNYLLDFPPLENSTQYLLGPELLTTAELQAILISKFRNFTILTNSGSILEIGSVKEQEYLDQLAGFFLFHSNVPTNFYERFFRDTKRKFSLNTVDHYLTEQSEILRQEFSYFNELELDYLKNCFQFLLSSCKKPANGFLEREDFTQACGSYLKISRMAHALFRGLDQDRSGSISLAKYLDGMGILLRGSLQEHLQFAFRMFNMGGGIAMPFEAFECIVEAVRILFPADSHAVDFVRFLNLQMDPERSGSVSRSDFIHIAQKHLRYIQTLGLESEPDSLDVLKKFPKSWPHGFPIVPGQDVWELVWHIMLSISESVRRTTNHPRGFNVALFAQEVEYKFDSGNSSSWIVKDFAPAIFKRIREEFLISDQEYLQSLGPDRFVGDLLLGKLSTYRTMNSTGRSGSVFFSSTDGGYFLKTLPEEEYNVLRNILSSYYHYIADHPNTLITRFCSLFRVRQGTTGAWMNIVIMQNLFNDPTFQIQEVYDLKGSTVNRSVEIKEGKERTLVARKDNDFFRKLKIGSLAKAVLLEQVEMDARFLEQFFICDYSLLVGLHFRAQPLKLNFRPPSVNSDAKIGQVQLKSPEQNLNEYLCSVDSQVSSREGSAFKRFHGGILSEDKNEVYVLGIIDTLTEYNYKKRGENLAKSFLHNPNDISAIPPSPYRKRYVKYIASIVE